MGPDNTGANPVQLTSDPKGGSNFPVWPPDGSMIAFQFKGNDCGDGGDSNDDCQIFVMDRNGNMKRRLSD